MPYNNPIVAGITLVIPAIQSPNYVAGVSGWAIFRNGTAEFNGGIFRGSVIVGPVTGAHVAIDGILPPFLSTEYSGFLSTISSFSIRLYPNSTDYYYEIVGTTNTSADAYINGWVRGGTLLAEKEQFIYAGLGTPIIHRFNANQVITSGTPPPTNWQFNGFANSSPLSTFNIHTCNITFDGFPDGNGSVTVAVPMSVSQPATFTGGVSVDDLTVTDKLFAQNIITGNAVITPSAPGASTTVAVTFPRAMPVGLTYGAVLGINSAAAGAITDVRYNAISNTGMNIAGTRTALTAFTVSYIAFGF